MALRTIGHRKDRHRARDGSSFPRSPVHRRESPVGAGPVAIATLSALVVLLAALSAYLWFFDDSGSGPGGGLSASTAEVSLPDELGDYTVDDSGNSYQLDLEQTREDYEDVAAQGSMPRPTFRTTRPTRTRAARSPYGRFARTPL